MSQPNAKPLAGPDQSYHSTMQAEQLRLLYAGVPAALLANLLLAGLLVFIQWPLIDTGLTVGWLAMLIVVIIGRGLVLLGYRRRAQAATAAQHNWLRRFRAGVFSTGLMWGMAGIALFPADNLSHQAYLAFVLAGISAGAITSLAVDRLSVLVFVLPALLPLTVNFVLEGGTISLAMSLMVALFMVFLASSASRTQTYLVENIRLRAETQAHQAALQQQQRLTEAIARAQSRFIRESHRPRVFDGLLTDLLDLTSSECGFISKMQYGKDGAPGLNSNITDPIVWMVQDGTPCPSVDSTEELELGGLLDKVLNEGVAVFANDTSEVEVDASLRRFLGIPVYHGARMVAVLGLANRRDDYEQALLIYLHPLLATLGQLVEAERIQQQHRQDQVDLARLSRVASQTTNGVIITDRQGRVEWINEGFTRITGYRLEDLRGHRPGDILQGEDSDPQTVAQMRQALQAEQAFNVDIVNYTKTGRPYWIRINCNPLRDSAGQLQGFMAIESDITQQKHAEKALKESEAQQSFLLASSPVVLYTCDTQPPFAATYISSNVFQQMGYSPGQFTDDSGFWADRIHPEDRQAVFNNLPQLFVHDMHQHEYRFRMADGEYRWVQDELRLIRDEAGEPLEIVGTWKDISERKRIDQMKTEFVSVVSHELRTPLTAISGALSLIAGGALGRLPEKIQDMIRIAHDNSKRLTLLINDLLDMDKLLAGKVRLDLQAHALRLLLEQAVDANRTYGSEHQVQLTVQEPIPEADVLVDQQRFMQIMSNLLSNAIKFSPHKGTVLIAAERRDKHVRISVSDQGPGIPEEFHQQLFQKFSQADATTTRQKGGTGLGLAITRELVERMGGQIGFHSQEGQGACFYFDLPSHSTH